MIFHENFLLADNSHEISYLIFFRNLCKMSQNVSAAAVVIGPLRANMGKAASFVVGLRPLSYFNIVSSNGSSVLNLS